MREDLTGFHAIAGIDKKIFENPGTARHDVRQEIRCERTRRKHVRVGRRTGQRHGHGPYRHGRVALDVAHRVHVHAVHRTGLRIDVNLQRRYGDGDGAGNTEHADRPWRAHAARHERQNDHDGKQNERGSAPRSDIAACARCHSGRLRRLSAASRTRDGDRECSGAVDSARRVNRDRPRRRHSERQVEDVSSASDATRGSVSSGHIH